MSYSSILGAAAAPVVPSGRSSDLLGPSDNSDSGSDAAGTSEIHGDSDAAGTGERGAVSGPDTKEGGDILPDQVVRIGDDEGRAELDTDAGVFTDLDDDAPPEPDGSLEAAHPIDARPGPAAATPVAPDNAGQDLSVEGGPGLRR
jgi:hypothetical protein